MLTSSQKLRLTFLRDRNSDENIFLEKEEYDEIHSLREREETTEEEDIINSLEKNLRQCMDWMESLRASGDAGSWGWENGSVYKTAERLLNFMYNKDNCRSESEN